MKEPEPDDGLGRYKHVIRKGFCLFLIGQMPDFYYFLLFLIFFFIFFIFMHDYFCFHVYWNVYSHVARLQIFIQRHVT